MKLVLLIATTLLLVAPARADTTWVDAGPVFDEWTVAGSPYCVLGPIVLSVVDTWNIGPGVEVLFFNNSSVVIYGELCVNGTPDSLVRMIGDTLSGTIWAGMTSIASERLELNHCVLSNAGQTGTALNIQGGEFAIRDCIIDGWSGRGLRLSDAASGLVKNTAITNCRATGIVAYGQVDVTIDACLIAGNRALDGAGIYADEAALTITNTWFRENAGSIWGGAIFLSECEAIIDRCVFLRNTVNLEGAALWSSYSTVAVTRTDFVDNFSQNGIDLFHGRYGEVVFNSCIFSGHEANVSFDGPFQADFCCFYQNGIEELPEGVGNFEAAPLFVEEEFDDFHLQPNSPCIDAGDPELPLDPDGTRADVGVFYFPQDTSEGIDPHPLPAAIELLQAYPNPFNAQTTLRFVLGRSGVVRLRVYDLLGREVALLTDERLAAGTHTAIWNPVAQSSGLYFAELNSASQHALTKIVLIK